MEESQPVPHEPENAAGPGPAAAKPRVVALLNQKGGVGKTTSTVNLGAALARRGMRVLLVDLDPQSNLSLHFGVETGPEQRTVRDLLLDPSCALRDAVQRARPGLDFVPAVTELALVEGELAQRDGMQSVLRSKLEPAFGDYDVILLDCPPSLGVLSVNALTVADEVFVPMQAHYLPLRGLEKLLQTVHLVSQGLNPSIRVTGILLCMHDGSSSHARAVIGEIEGQLERFRAADVPWAGARVLDPPVRRNIKLAEAPSFGQTIFDYAPRCPGAQDYLRIADGLLERWGIAPADAVDERPEPGRPRRAARGAVRGAAARTSSRGKKRPGRGPKAKPKRGVASRTTRGAKPRPAREAGARPGRGPKARPARGTKARSGRGAKARVPSAAKGRHRSRSRSAAASRAGRSIRSGGLSL